jgi:hypothetical protein
MTREMLPQDVVDEIVKITSLIDGALLVGGQAHNFWAQRYLSNEPKLGQYEPFVTKDIDFLGTSAVAAHMATALGGKLIKNSMNDASPEVARIKAVVLGKEVEIDLLGHILGPPADRVNKDSVVLICPVQSKNSAGEVPITILHPLHCLQSRAANVIKLGRSNDVAKRQLAASPIILRAYLDEFLGDGSDKKRVHAATTVMKSLGGYLKSDIIGKQIHMRSRQNPLDVLKSFATDKRLDERYRENQLKTMINEIANRQKQDRAKVLQMNMQQGLGR